MERADRHRSVGDEAMRDMRRLVRLACAVALAATAATAYVLTCGPFLTVFRTVEQLRPAQIEPYDRGDLGIIREHFARRYLVQAFRRLNGNPAIPVSPQPEPVTPFVPADQIAPIKAWRELHQRVTGTDPKIDTDRRIGDYQLMSNCLLDAYASAEKTARARVDKYGADSSVVRDWFRAQDAVLANCSGTALVLPDPAPASADALARADRAYQTAAAHFYAMEFDEAARRFQQIAVDPASPWRPYGRYLAGRARLRQATIPETLDRQQMLAAQAEFRATLADRDAAFLHESAKGLLNLIEFRIEPVQHLRALSAPIASGNTVATEQLTEYERLLNVLLGDVATYEYSGIADRAAIAGTSDLNDWIMVMQGTGDGAAARAVEQWKRSSAPAWLVASLWKIPANHPEAPAVLDAATRVAPASPAFLTVAFLRVRLLAERGNVDQARALLATLPHKAAGNADAEAVNMLIAERFMLARSLDELLQNAPRLAASKRWDVSAWNDTEPDPDPGGPLQRAPVFDDDTAIVFSRRLPLTRLVEASRSQALPARLRLRVGSAAFTRAWMLGRDDEALAVAPVLRALSPSLAADLQTFEAAPAAERHLAGLRLLLRTPGLTADVKGLEDDQDYGQRDLSRDFEHTFRRNWWCAIPAGDRSLPPSESALLPALYRTGDVPAPSFLSADERATARRELDAMAAIGTAPNYLAAEAVKWAKTRPTDLDAAEGLAHAVEGTRWGCRDPRTTAASRTAFQTLHQLFPRSEWARRTRYWY
jgi:hypothetical protein